MVRPCVTGFSICRRRFPQRERKERGDFAPSLTRFRTANGSASTPYGSPNIIFIRLQDFFPLHRSSALRLRKEQLRFALERPCSCCPITIHFALRRITRRSIA